MCTTTISISGKQTGGSHHSIAITVIEARYLVSPSFPLKTCQEAALSDHEQSSFQNLLSAKCLSYRTNGTPCCINHPAASVVCLTDESNQDEIEELGLHLKNQILTL